MLLFLLLILTVCFAFAATLGFSSNIDYYALATIPIHSDKDVDNKETQN